jgi:hypothetical protein
LFKTWKDEEKRGKEKLKFLIYRFALSAKAGVLGTSLSRQALLDRNAH